MCGTTVRPRIYQELAMQFNALRPRQNVRHFADDPFKRIFLNETISIKISLNFVPKGPINDIPALVQISEPVMVCLLTHICVTWPQWFNKINIQAGVSFTFINITVWDYCFDPLFLLKLLSVGRHLLTWLLIGCRWCCNQDSCQEIAVNGFLMSQSIIRLELNVWCNVKIRHIWKRKKSH